MDKNYEKHLFQPYDYINFVYTRSERKNKKYFNDAYEWFWYKLVDFQILFKVKMRIKRLVENYLHDGYIELRLGKCAK